MIYNKDATFSYPILAHSSNGYENNYFSFEVNLYDDQNNYIFEFEYEIDNEFIKSLISEGKAILIFIIQSKDNYFTKLEKNQKSVSIPKNRISLSSNTSIQLHIQSTETITFDNCEELTPFYNTFKDQITIKKHMLLGYSNIEKYLGSENKSLDLFESTVDSTMKSAFKVELSAETIILKFNDEKMLLRSVSRNTNILNMYLYAGLSRAVDQFIKDNINDEEYIDIESLNGNQTNVLNQKLLDLMVNKGIKEVNPDDIDEVISKISNRIVEKFVNTIEGVVSDGD